MLLHTLQARRGLWLFHDWEEARALWDRLLAIAPAHHLCLMPDRALLLAQRVPEAGLWGAMSGYSRWLGHRWGWPGLRLWRPLAPPTLVVGSTQLAQARLRILRAPCRGGLVDDPLGWAFSTHRDATGLAWPAARAQVADPPCFHASVSSRRGQGHGATALPGPPLGPAGYDEVLSALSAVSRTPVPALTRRGRARRELIHCARSLTALSTRDMAERLAMTHSGIARVLGSTDDAARVVERVIGDRRFPALLPGDLRGTAMWLRYRAYLSSERRCRIMPASSKTSENRRIPSQAP